MLCPCQLRSVFLLRHWKLCVLGVCVANRARCVSPFSPRSACFVPRGLVFCSLLEFCALSVCVCSVGDRLPAVGNARPGHFCRIGRSVSVRASRACGCCFSLSAFPCVRAISTASWVSSRCCVVVGVRARICSGRVGCRPDCVGLWLPCVSPSASIAYDHSVFMLCSADRAAADDVVHPAAPGAPPGWARSLIVVS